jgi:hypothetical protein
MLAVIWGIDGFHVIDPTAQQHNYNRHSFLSNVMEPLLRAIFPDGRKVHSRGLRVHLENCHGHRSKASQNFFVGNDIVRIPHRLVASGSGSLGMIGSRFPPVTKLVPKVAPRFLAFDGIALVVKRSLQIQNSTCRMPLFIET